MRAAESAEAKAQYELEKSKRRKEKEEREASKKRQREEEEEQVSSDREIIIFFVPHAATFTNLSYVLRLLPIYVTAEEDGKG